jgi:hypothetical protein
MPISSEIVADGPAQLRPAELAGSPSSAGALENMKISLVIRRSRDGPELLRSCITEADVADGFSELWLDLCLRKGRPNVPIDSVTFIMRPLLSEGARSFCAGIELEATDDQGHVLRRELQAAAFQDVSLRLAQQLIAAGTLKNDDTYCYELAVGSPRAGLAETAPEIKTITKNPPLLYLPCPIASLRQQARTVGSIDDHTLPVFYTEAALKKAERFARNGAQQPDPVESGCVLVGPACSCPESGEFFVVACDALELLDAEGTKFSLAYTGKTWTRLQTVIRAMQSQPATAAYRMLGQAHGHNWLPLNGAPPCENCSKLKVCGRTTVFASLDDRIWMRCVFTRQPWQLCHIFGLNARSEQVQGLFGLRDNQLQERGYYVIPSFEI